MQTDLINNRGVAPTSVTSRKELVLLMNRYFSKSLTSYP